MNHVTSHMKSGWALALRYPYETPPMDEPPKPDQKWGGKRVRDLQNRPQNSPIGARHGHADVDNDSLEFHHRSSRLRGCHRGTETPRRERVGYRPPTSHAHTRVTCGGVKPKTEYWRDPFNGVAQARVSMPSETIKGKGSHSDPSNEFRTMHSCKQETKWHEWRCGSRVKSRSN